MSFKFSFRHTVFFSNFWVLCSVFTVAFLLASASYADDAADIARLLELGDAYQEAGKQFRAKKITKKKLQERRKAIQQESRKINERYGKKGSSTRVAWDKKVLAAKNQHKKDKRLAVQAAEAKASAEAQAKRMEKKQKAAEEAAANNAAKQAELMKITREYSQVHLPEEVFIPLKSTDVQDIQYGMTKEEADKILKEKGYLEGGAYFYKTDEQSHRTFDPLYGDLFLPEQRGLRVSGVIYKQRFKPEIKFNLEKIKQILLDKFGPPTSQYENVNGVGLSYQPEQPGYNIQGACSEEMARRGTTPTGMLAVHPMAEAVWSERGERDVIERCPDQLNAFRQFMHFKLGVWASISANPRTKEIAIEYRDNGVGMRKFRHMKEEKFLKIDSGPEAEVGL